MAHISPIHHSARTEEEYRRAARVCEGGALYYLVTAVRSALFVAALEFKMSFFYFIFFFFAREQTENSPLSV